MIAEVKPYPAYQDSAVPWLGDIPAHWETERAKWLFQRMKRPVRPEDDVVTCFRDGTVTLRKNRRVRGFTNALKEIGYQGVRRGDLVIHAMDAFAGAVGVSDSEGKCTPVYAVCQPQSDSSPHYYAYVVREMARSQWIAALAKGVRERSTDFRFGGFAAQAVPVPPTDEQDHITTFLGYIDRRTRRYIRGKRKLIALLEERKQAIIQRAVTRGLYPYVRLKPSGVDWLGEIPEHWEVVLNQRIFKEETRPHGGQAETQLSLSQKDGLIPTSAMKERSLQTSTYDNWKVTIPGDLVLNRFKAHLGVFFSSTLRGIVSFHYGVFAPRRPLISKYFELLYHTNPYKTIYAGRSNGMTVGLQNLSNQNFYNVRSTVPPVREQMEIVSFVEMASERLNGAIDAAHRKIDLVREYRACLISEVVTGKLDVRQAAASLPEEVEESEDLVDEDKDLDEADAEADNGE